MKMVEPKTENEIKLDGIKVEITKKNSSVIRVVLRDTSGNILEIGKDGYSDLSVLIPAPPAKKKVWTVKGEIEGIKVNENFEHKFEADARRTLIANRLSAEESEFSIEESEILEVA